MNNHEDCLYSATYANSFSAEMTFDKDVLLKLMESFPVIPPPKVACVHPNNVEYFQRYPIAESMIVSDVVSEFAVPHWEPLPWGPFVTLEKSDEPWARPLGLGHMVDSKERVAYLIDQSMLNFEFEVTRPTHRPCIGIESVFRPQLPALLATPY